VVDATGLYNRGEFMIPSVLTHSGTPCLLERF